MKKTAALLKGVVRFVPIAGLSLLGLVVYAASSYQVNNGSTVQVNEHGVCQNVGNSSGLGIFVPTNSALEWSEFRSHLPGGVGLSPCYSYSWQVGGWGGCSVSCGVGTQYRSVWCQRSDGATVDNSYCGGGMPGGSQACDMGSCCAGNYGQGCASSPNNCGSVNYGTYQCDGSCNASTPGNVPDRWVCGSQYCANSDYTCYWDGYNENCSYECVDWEQNCGWESGC